MKRANSASVPRKSSNGSGNSNSTNQNNSNGRQVRQAALSAREPQRSLNPIHSTTERQEVNKQEVTVENILYALKMSNRNDIRETVTFLLNTVDQHKSMEKANSQKQLTLQMIEERTENTATIPGNIIDGRKEIDAEIETNDAAFPYLEGGVENSKRLFLDRLNLSCIRTLSEYSFAPSITHLYLQHNNIIDISPLAGCSSLEFLTLTNNQVEAITTLSSLAKLEFCDVSNNCIEDFDVDALPTSLLILNMQGNNCTSHPNYRHHVVVSLPILTMLDGVQITEEFISSLHQYDENGEIIESESEDEESEGSSLDSAEPKNEDSLIVKGRDWTSTNGELQGKLLDGKENTDIFQSQDFSLENDTALKDLRASFNTVLERCFQRIQELQEQTSTEKVG